MAADVTGDNRESSELDGDRSKREAPEFPQIEEVAPGLHRLSVPLPYDPRKVNIWVESNDDQVLLLDAGTDDPACRAALLAGLETLGLRPDQVTDVIVSHAHVDHFGLAGWLRADFGARIHMHPAETLVLDRYLQPEGWITEFQAYFERHGMPADLAAELSAIEDWRQWVSPIDGFHPVRDGDIIQGPRYAWQVIHTPGHTPGHVCLWNEDSKILFSGDHFLKVYSPHLRHVAEELPDPLGSYLRELDRVVDLEPTLVLPGHGRPFADISTVAADAHEEHERVEVALLNLIETSHSAYELVRLYYGDGLPKFHLRLALPQLVVYLRNLEQRGAIYSELRGGCIHYAAQDEPHSGADDDADFVELSRTFG